MLGSLSFATKSDYQKSPKAEYDFQIIFAKGLKGKEYGWSKTIAP